MNWLKRFFWDKNFKRLYVKMTRCWWGDHDPCFIEYPENGRQVKVPACYNCSWKGTPQ